MSENTNKSLWSYIKLGLTFRFISNLSIIICILAYYMDAFQIFFILAPCLIVNLFVITLIIIFDNDAFMEKFKNNGSMIALFAIIWHIIPIFWLMYILQSDDIIKIFHPDFIEIFLKSLILPIIYYYYEIDLKVYGDINYLFYLIIYIILLLATCFYLYKK